MSKPFTATLKSVALACLGALGFAGAAQAQISGDVVHIGFITDMSGVYADIDGQGGVEAIKMAIADMGGAINGKKIELVVADHQNKPDVAATIARQWYDQGIDATVDVPTSSVALAVAQVAKEKDKIMLNASATVAALTWQQCSPNSIVWSFDTYENAHNTGGALMASGNKSWFFITANYAFGQSLADLTKEVVVAGGGEVKGDLRYPFPDTTDFSSYLTQAQASGAKVLGLANAGLDTQNCIKQAAEFGLNKSMKIAPLLLFLTDVHSLGLDVCAGLTTTETFYWDLNDRTRAFTKRLIQKTPNNYPNQAHASSYAITLHYLKTVQAMGAPEAKKSGRSTVAKMKSIATDDDAFGKGRVRADGRGEFPAYLFQVKTKAESKGPWDLYKLQHTSPPADVLHPLADSCKFPTT